MSEQAATYDDGYGSDRGDAAIELLDAVSDLIDQTGPVVCEKVTCTHCGYIEIAVHAFMESVSCGDCGLRNVSIVPKYPDLHRLDGPL